MAIRVHSPSMRLATTRATSTTLAVSQNTRISSTEFRYGAGSSRICPSRTAPPRFSSVSSWARARENEDSAASMLASTPAATASRTDDDDERDDHDVLAGAESWEPSGSGSPPRCHSSSSRPWTPNISRCSSGEAWS